jgi:hypothetical protein
MSEYLAKLERTFERFEKEVEELKKLEYCDLYSITEENLGEVSNEIANKLISTFGIPEPEPELEYEVMKEDVVHDVARSISVARAIRNMLYQEPSIKNEVAHRSEHDDCVMIHVYSPRIIVDHTRNECLLAPFTLRCNARNFDIEGTAHVAELFAAFDFPKLRFWGPHCYIVKGDRGSRYVELDWRDHDEPGYPEFKKIKSTEVIGAGYIDGLWATVLTKGDLDYVHMFVGNDFDEVNILDMYEE